MKKKLLLSFLCLFIFSQKINAIPVDVIKKKAITEESVQKKKKNFFARMTERIMKKRAGKMLKKLKVNSTKCDRIITNDGKEIDVKIVKIGEERIRYKKCDFQNGPTHSIRKEDIFMIKYADGTEEIIKDIETLNENKKQTRKTASQDDDLKLYWNVGFWIGIFISFGIFALVVFALVLKGEKRKQLFRGVLSGMLTAILIFITLAFLLLSFG